MAMAFVVVCILLLLETNCCWTQSAMENTKEQVNVAAGNAKVKAEEIKQTTGEAMENAKEKGESWKDWATEKFSEGFANQQETAHNLMGKATDAAFKTKETMINTASGAAELAADKAGKASNMAYEKAGEAKEAMKDAMSSGKDEDPKQKEKDAYKSMSDEAKTNSEAAKEKAGELGDQTRNVYEL